MPSHRIQKSWPARLAALVPFGLGQAKPKHFRDMAAIVWRNRDNLAYAWKVLAEGVCDGCALGTAGLRDWTLSGTHLCMTRLNLLRLNTMPAMDVSLLEDVSRLATLSNAQLRELGRLPFPMVREENAPGFRRISWEEAYARIGSHIQSSTPNRLAFYLTARGVTNEVYYMAQKVARFLGTNNVDNAARLCHAPSTAAMKLALGVAATTCSYRDWYGSDLVEAASGLGRTSMQEFAELIRDARTGVLVWSMGITQHAFGADAVQTILNLGLAKGWVGRDKCGLMPIRGHSSVQGGAEMGAYATAFPGGKPVNINNAAALAAEYGFPVPAEPGLTTTEMVEAAARGELDLLYGVGGNFLRTLPEPDYVRRAMARVPMRVHQDIIVTDQMFIEAGEQVLLLPAKTRYEQDDGGTETSTERRIIFSPELPRQVGEARAEWKILRDLAGAAFPERAGLLGCEDGWSLRAEIARVVPLYEGIQRLRQAGEAFQYGGPHLCANGDFPTPDGKAHFAAVAVPASGPPRRGHGAPGREFRVATRRGKQFNSLIYAEVDPLTGAARDAVLMSPDDAAALHLVHGDRVALVNEWGRFEGRVFLAPLARGTLQIHWPEGNVMVRKGVTDPRGGVPDYNAWITLERIA